MAQPSTIDYRCKRCGLYERSLPLPTSPTALKIYGLPKGWTLGSAHAPRLVLAVGAEDFCLCTACSTDIDKGYPLNIADLARRAEGGTP